MLKKKNGLGLSDLKFYKNLIQMNYFSLTLEYDLKWN